MPSFDVVSEIDLQELDNAVNQTEKEISQRFDFRGSNSEISFDRKSSSIQLISNSEQKIEDIFTILQSKAIKRQIDIKALKLGKIEAMGGQKQKATVTLVEGIDKDNAKKITKYIKDQKFKVQAAIHDDKVKVTGKKRDDLQEVISQLKSGPFDLPLQFNNFRD